MTIAINSYPGGKPDLVTQPHAGVFAADAFGGAETHEEQGQLFNHYGRPRDEAEITALVGGVSHLATSKAGVKQPELPFPTLNPYFDVEQGLDEEADSFRDMGMRQTPAAIEASIRSSAR